MEILESSEEFKQDECFDYIFCNPACYPSIVGESSFYYAGDNGLDMIEEVFNFAKRTLKKSGNLFLLLPSVSPASVAFEHLNKLNFSKKFIASTYVILREHLSEKIRNWVDVKSKNYPEMQYFMENDNYCERVDLFDIFFDADIDVSLKPKKILLVSAGGTVVQSKDKDGITVISNDMEHYKILQDLKREASKSFSYCNSSCIETPEIDLLPLLNKDSSNIVPSDWDVIINAIVNNYDKFDSFIVLHGTNTMGYTCASLSFAFEHLGELVIFTGAQIPYGNPGSDALQNVENAIQLAIQQNHEIYGVVAVFGDNIIPGMRVKKTISSGYDAFKTFGNHNDSILGKTVGMKLNCSAIGQLKSFYVNPAKSAEELSKNIKRCLNLII